MTSGDGAGGPAHTRISAAPAAALLRKYQVLAAWRRSKDAEAAAVAPPEAGALSPPAVAGLPPTATADRAALAALAREFPGALRELDVLGLPEITRRIARLSSLIAADTDTAAASASPGDFAPGQAADADDDRWMALIVAYHGLMRAALTVKRASARTRAVSAAFVAQTLASVGESCGFAVGESFVRAAIRPPGGRLGVVVLTTLAEQFQLPATEISRMLFPPRRPAPYRLPS